VSYYSSFSSQRSITTPTEIIETSKLSPCVDTLGTDISIVEGQSNSLKHAFVGFHFQLVAFFVRKKNEPLRLNSVLFQDNM
jgi:hypothetical protein